MNRLSSHKHLALLLALLLLLVAYPVLRGPAGSPVLAESLLTAVFLAGGWVVFADRRLRFPAVLLGGPAVLGVWTGYALPDRPGPAVAALFHLSAAAFQVFVVVVLLRGVYRERTVSADAVAAALCGYLLLGVAFGHVYCLIDAAVPGSFRGIDPGAGGHRTHFLFTYFSFITLTTVGYGDITPGGDTARALALVESVAGQFYLAVLIADLVGKRVAQAVSAQHPPVE